MSVIEVGGRLALFGSSVGVVTGGTGLAITTSFLNAAIVGNTYALQMTASGGSGNYAWSLDSCTPWDQRWVQITPSGMLSGNPQMAEVEMITIRLTDTTDETSVTQTYALTVTATGALAIVSGASVVASANGPLAYQLLGYGGVPPYTWSCGNKAQPWDVTWNGWVNGAPSNTGIVTLYIVLTDSLGTSALQTLTITVNSALQLAGVDPTLGWINLPPAIAGQPYLANVYAFAGAGSGYSFSATGLPAWATLNTNGNAGMISGTPTLSGNVAPTIALTDALSNTASATTLMNVSPSQSGAARGYFSVQNGKLYDPSGNLFRIRGADRTHFDSPTWGSGQNGGLTGANAVRVFIFDTESAAYAVTQCQQQYLTAAAGGSSTTAMLPILTLSTTGGTATSGNTSPTILSDAVTEWVGYYSTLAPIQNYIIINIANEWGPAASATWQSSYESAVSSLRTAGYTCPILIDSGGSGQDMVDVFTYAAAIQAADPLQNCIFALHPYGSVSNTQIGIAGITNANPMVVTLSSNLPYHPMNPAYPLASSNTFSQVQTYQFAGVNGMTQANGLQTMTGTNPVGGSQGAWTMTFTGVNSSTWGAYTNGGTISPADKSNSYAHYNWLAQQCAAQAASNVCIGFFEFGPGNPWNSPATLFTGSISGTTLTVSTVQAGPILTNAIGTFGYGGTQLTGSDIPTSILISNQLTQSGGDTPGYRGTYQLSASPGTIGAEQMWICNSYGSEDAISFFSGATGPSPTQVPAGQLICAAEAYGLNWCQWSPDDHNLSTNQEVSWIGWFGWFNENLTFGPQLINWVPGFHALSDTTPVGQANSPKYGTNFAYNGSFWQTEMGQAYTGFQTANVNSQPTVVGYGFYVTWGGMEYGTSGFPGTYQFQGPGGTTYFLDTLMNDARAKGLKVFWIINPNNFEGAGSKVGPSGTNPGMDPGVGSGIVPNYILNNASLYGAPQLGTNGGSANPSNPATSGFYIQFDYQWSANITNSNVRSALLACLQALATAYDGDPAFGGIIFDAWDVMQPDTGCAAASTFASSLQTLYTTAKSYFTKSNVFFQGGFAPSPVTTYQQLTQTLITDGILCSASDSGGINLWSSSCLPVTSFVYTNSGGTSSGTYSVNANAYSSGQYTLALSTGQQLTVAATFISSGAEVQFSWTATTTVTGSPTGTATISYFPANLNQSVQAYLNIQAPGSSWSPPSPTLYSYGPYVGLYEVGDLNAGPNGPIFPVNVTTLQAIQAANTAPPNGYGQSHFFLGIDSNWSANISVMAANPLTNTAYPTVYE